MLYTYRARIVSVYDGDTCTVDIDQGFGDWKMGQKLRFYGVNTPEIRGPERPAGIIVRDQVRAWLPEGAEVTIETIKDRTGKFGRWLAIITADGWEESINARLLADKLAKIEAYSERGEAEVIRRLSLNA